MWGIVVKQLNWMDCLVLNVFYICFCLFLIDVIKSVSTLATENCTGQSWAKIDTISARAPWVLHGSRLDRVQITEVESRKSVYTAGIQRKPNVLFLEWWSLGKAMLTA